ncbi:unnamed protein product [Dibothriocephalus latus]|uniref:PDZ domain-containing protein n=1 Tax=Dibothriocephalus latus TaxID=60516 RepID=A0A3P7LR41_DIBLA|nr:unnamed protein product [Dibothriocephalus latus]
MMMLMLTNPLLKNFAQTGGLVHLPGRFLEATPECTEWMSQKSSRKSSSETAPTASSVTSQQLYTGHPGLGRAVYEEVHVARLLRGKNGFGFAIMDKSFTNEPGIYIKQLVENGPAMLNGTLRAGDRIIRVDWHDALHANYESVLEWLRSARHQVS